MTIKKFTSLGLFIISVGLTSFWVSHATAPFNYASSLESFSSSTSSVSQSVMPERLTLENLNTPNISNSIIIQQNNNSNEGGIYI